MDFFKKIWEKIKNPHGIYLILFYIVFAIIISTTLLLVFLIPNQTFWHFLLYPFAAMSLTYFVYTIVYFSPKMREDLIKLLRKNKITSGMLDDYGYRTLVLAIISFILNIAYILFIAVMAIKSLSIWYISIAIYYLVLFFMKGNVLYSKKVHNTPIKQAKTYRLSGILFIVLTVAFSGIMLLTYKINTHFEYAGLIIYAVALFTFYKLGLAIFNIFKARKQDDLYIQSIRNINLASALISIVVLQVAMFQAFSPESNLNYANAITGGVMCLIILILGVYMFINANNTIKNLNKEQTKDE